MGISQNDLETGERGLKGVYNNQGCKKRAVPLTPVTAKYVWWILDVMYEFTLKVTGLLQDSYRCEEGSRWITTQWQPCIFPGEHGHRLL